MQNNLKHEFRRWFQQAKFDLKSAVDSLNNTNYEWACFQAQQSAEKTLKAFLYLNGEDVMTTHSVFTLSNVCKKYSPEFEKIEKQSKELDKYYIPTRYPNGLPDEIPHIFYTKEDAEKCVSYAREILTIVEKLTNL
ncbi:MAG: HEPN domain-containing protein [Elusimicrobiota bacterium]